MSFEKDRVENIFYTHLQLLDFHYLVFAFHCFPLFNFPMSSIVTLVLLSEFFLYKELLVIMDLSFTSELWVCRAFNVPCLIVLLKECFAFFLVQVMEVLRWNYRNVKRHAIDRTKAN